MQIKFLVDEDFVNYKKCAMFVGFPNCSFKCDRECGRNVCQNSALAKLENLPYSVGNLIERYLSNPIHKALVIGGLEPFDDYSDLFELVSEFRKFSNDDIVIYTGYNFEEIIPQVKNLAQFSNLVIKFGRYIPDEQSHKDEVLGVFLSSPNQYAAEITPEWISSHENQD